MYFVLEDIISFVVVTQRIIKTKQMLWVSSRITTYLTFHLLLQEITAIRFVQEKMPGKQKVVGRFRIGSRNFTASYHCYKRTFSKCIWFLLVFHKVGNGSSIGGCTSFEWGFKNKYFFFQKHIQTYKLLEALEVLLDRRRISTNSGLSTCCHSILVAATIDITFLFKKGDISFLPLTRTK